MNGVKTRKGLLNDLFFLPIFFDGLKQSSL